MWCYLNQHAAAVANARALLAFPAGCLRDILMPKFQLDLTRIGQNLDRSAWKSDQLLIAIVPL